MGALALSWWSNAPKMETLIALLEERTQVASPPLPPANRPIHHFKHPLAASIAGTAEAACLSLILFTRLRKKIRTDKGWSRLKERRLQGARGAVALAGVDELS